MKRLVLSHTLSGLVALGVSVAWLVLLAMDSAGRARTPLSELALNVGGNSPRVTMVCLVVGWIACALRWPKVVIICTALPWIYFLVSVGVFAWATI